MSIGHLPLEIVARYDYSKYIYLSIREFRIDGRGHVDCCRGGGRDSKGISKQNHCSEFTSTICLHVWRSLYYPWLQEIGTMFAALPIFDVFTGKEALVV